MESEVCMVSTLTQWHNQRAALNINISLQILVGDKEESPKEVKTSNIEKIDIKNDLKL